MSRTPEEWEEVCKLITTGYAPGGKYKRPNLYEHGRKWVRDRLKPLCLWESGDVVVDVGSGNGRVAMGLVQEDIEYHGIDVSEGAVEFCHMAFKPWPNFHFHHLDVRNGRYNKTGTIPPDRVIFPFENSRADLVLAVSLFSHLETLEAARRYVAEARRVLRLGGVLYSSWFRAPPNEVSEDAARTVYREADIMNLLARFRILDTFRGISQRKGDQWAIVARLG